MDDAELITDLTGIGGLEDEWRAHAERRGNAFLTPEWALAWFRHYGAEAHPMLITAPGRDGGVLPLVRSTSGRPRTVRFAGANLGDHFHPACAEALEPELAAQAAELLDRDRGFGAIVLDNVDLDGAWWRAIASGGGRRLAALTYRRAPLPYTRLAGTTWEDLLAQRSRNFRSQVRRRERRLEREHRLRFRMTSEQRELGPDLDTFFRLHLARWAGRGGSSSDSPRAAAFHADFAAAALQRGWLRLWFLEADGEEVAAWYGWRLGGRYSYYLAGFAPEWGDRNVGSVLFAHTVRSAIEEGADEYDMLLGDEAYKSRFATGERVVCTAVLTPRLHPARLLFSAETVGWRAARGLPSPLRRAARAVARHLPGARRR